MSIVNKFNITIIFLNSSDFVEHSPLHNYFEIEKVKIYTNKIEVAYTNKHVATITTNHELG
jgi:hypothetical protein